MSEYKYVGKSIPRIDALAKVTGKAKFTNDYKLARMLYAKVLRSPYPHAKIILGGNYASLCPDHAKSLGADFILSGSQYP
ncbi:MAG: hypothetical protein ABGF52_13000 [Candidatus Asgardarchaeum sp.]